MRHTPFLDKVADWSHLTKRLGNSLGIVEEQVFCEMRVKKRFVMDNIQVVVNELFLERPVVAQNNAVTLGTSGITKQMRNLLLT